MLTDSGNIVHSGSLDQGIHLPFTSRLELLNFIAEELPKWRDHADRPAATAENTLTEYLCDHLNCAAYYSSIWSHVQFRSETIDKTHSGRKIDLAVKPRATAIFIEGRRHSQFDTLFRLSANDFQHRKGKTETIANMSQLVPELQAVSNVSNSAIMVPHILLQQ